MADHKRKTRLALARDLQLAGWEVCVYRIKAVAIAKRLLANSQQGVVSSISLAGWNGIPPGSRGWREYDVPSPPEIIASRYGEGVDEGETEGGIANAHFQP
ncbi:predicted protein [Histoplasma capsulatum G186AR]|uniref:Uncharacterized protein n=1 Tax=Ajellomyces capsulatus (strain G186AR / H82 / ATCC MYA-2454 / RMSCC 2432) TaxID=447093 RepID=C0NYL8_AJECG|nr:uncharacterized protein HCBG_08248 [Histoplasma capsulatum G186AR]EEH03308.1 predicted protein [Histoplasma capsulatum G186AR]